MSAPHHDTRIINGTPWLLFGPFAGWSPKFLKQGHLTTCRCRSSRTTWTRCSTSCKRCFGDRFGTAWRPRLEQMIPSLGVALSDEPALFHEVWDWGTRVLGLQTSGARTAAPSA